MLQREREATSGEVASLLCYQQFLYLVPAASKESIDSTYGMCYHRCNNRTMKKDELPDPHDAVDLLVFGSIAALRQMIQALQVYRKVRRAALTTPPKDGGKAA